MLFQCIRVWTPIRSCGRLEPVQARHVFSRESTDKVQAGALCTDAANSPAPATVLCPSREDLMACNLEGKNYHLTPNHHINHRQYVYQQP